VGSGILLIVLFCLDGEICDDKELLAFDALAQDERMVRIKMTNFSFLS